MTIFKRAGHRPTSQTKLQKRVASISTPELVTWTETTLFTIGKNVTHGQRNRAPELLAEAEQNAEALLAVVQELRRRMDEYSRN
jgi:hypothetical protein